MWPTGLAMNDWLSAINDVFGRERKLRKGLSVEDRGARSQQPFGDSKQVLYRCKVPNSLIPWSCKRQLNSQALHDHRPLELQFPQVMVSADAGVVSPLVVHRVRQVLAHRLLFFWLPPARPGLLAGSGKARAFPNGV